MKKFKKGDSVIVISGSNKGKIGKVLSANVDKIIIEGLNLATIHKKPSSNESGKILKIEKPIHISNVSHVENEKPVKIAILTKAGEGKPFSRKIRVSKKTQKEF